MVIDAEIRAEPPGSQVGAVFRSEDACAQSMAEAFVLHMCAVFFLGTHGVACTQRKERRTI